MHKLDVEFIEVFYLGSYYKVPEGTKYMATDKNGMVRAYGGKPVLPETAGLPKGLGIWYAQDGIWSYIAKQTVKANWTLSLTAIDSTTVRKAPGVDS